MNIILSLKKRWQDHSIQTILISCYLWGLVTHGMALFNKYSYHDDIAHFFRVGLSYSLGRWSLGLLGSIIKLLFGTSHYSTPVFNGFLTILFIAFCLILLADYLEIQSKAALILLSGLMISFPTVTALFGFVYTAPYYFFSMFIGILGAYLFYANKSLKSFLICVGLMSFSVGIYQAIISVLTSTLLLFMCKKIVLSKMKWKAFLSELLQNGAICFCFMAVYFILNKLTLLVLHIEMSNYKSANTFGLTSPINYMKRVLIAYREYIIPTATSHANMYPFSTQYLHYILLTLSVVLTIVVLLTALATRRASQLQFLFIAILYPLSAYLPYLMCEEKEVHGLMTYSEVFPLIFSIWMIGLIKKDQLKQSLCTLGYAFYGCIVLLTVLYLRFANVCYLKAEMLQAEAISYYTTLITRIQQTAGYEADMPVVYINDDNKSTQCISGADRFNKIYLPPYHWDSIINNYEWENTMTMWCGFSPIKGDPADYYDNSIVVRMPSYPDDGSIAIIDNTLVVKFADSAAGDE